MGTEEFRTVHTIPGRIRVKVGALRGNADLALRFSQGRGPSFWVGAGPTYYYVTNASESSEGYAHNGVFSALAEHFFLRIR